MTHSQSAPATGDDFTLLIEDGPKWIQRLLWTTFTITGAGLAIPVSIFFLPIGLSWFSPDASENTQHWFFATLWLFWLIPAGMTLTFLVAWTYETWRRRTFWAPIKSGLVHAFLFIIGIFYIAFSAA